MAVQAPRQVDKEMDANGNPIENSASGPKTTNTGASSTATASSPAPAMTSSTPGAKQGTSSGQFTNLKSYINANRNFNQAGGGLAGKVADNLNTQGQQVKNQVQGAVDTFKNTANEQTSQLQNAGQVAQQAIVNPAEAVKNEQTVNQVTQARDAQYTGPKNLMDLSGNQNQAALQSNAQNFTQSVDQGKTERGRYNLLNSMFGRPTYNSGQQNLDNLLISGQKDQLQKINETSRIAADVNRNLTRGIEAANTQGQQAVQTANDIREQTRNALNQRASQEYSDIEGKLTTAQDAQNRSLYDLVKGLQGGYISQADAERFGLTDGQKLYNTNLTSLIQRGADPTLESVADSGNYQQIDALRKLIGDTHNEETSKFLAGFNDPNLAGSFNANNYQLAKNSNALQTSISGDEAAYNSVIKQPTDNINNIYQPRMQDNLANAQSLQNTISKLEKDYNDPRNIPIRESIKLQIDAYKRNLDKTLGDIEWDKGLIAQAQSQINQANKDYNVNNTIRVAGDGVATVSDYDQVDPRTGMTKGEQLLRSLGLLK